MPVPSASPSHSRRSVVQCIEPSDLATLERTLEERDVTLFFSESPTNPYLRCVDVRRISELCHAKGALVCIDSTFATPVNQRALSLGADIVIHSATKYLAGHNDVMAGALAGNNDLVRSTGEGWCSIENQFQFQLVHTCQNSLAGYMYM